MKTVLSMLLVSVAAVLIWLLWTPSLEPEEGLRAEAEQELPAEPEPVVAPASSPEVADIEPALPAEVARTAVESEPDLEHAVTGTVVDDRGEPIDRFQLFAAYRSAGEKEWQQRDLGEGEGGAFALDGLEDGTWKFSAEAAGHALEKKQLVRVPVRASRRKPVQLVLVRQSQLAGQVVDTFGAGVAGALVMAGTGAGRTALTDADGLFQLELAPGPFELVASAEEHAPSVGLRGTAAEGERIDDVLLHLRSGGGVTGEVLFSDGAPRSGWWIDVTSTDWRLMRPLQGGNDLQADEVGRFAMENLAPGTYSINAVEGEQERPGPTPLRTVVTVVEGQTEHVVLGGINEDETLIHGLVELHGEPAVNHMVWGLNEGVGSYSSGQTLWTDASGRFELTLPSAGRVMILVALNPRGTESAGTTTFHLDLPQEPEHDVTLELPLASIAGLVLGPDGEPIRSKTVRLSAEDEDPVSSLYLQRTTRCDKEGRFVFEQLKAARYRVVLTGAAGPAARRDGVQLEPGEARSDVVLRILPHGGTEVTVVDSEGRPVQGAALFAHDEEGRAYGMGRKLTSNADGKVTFRKLATGTYRFLARKEGLATASSAPVTVRDGDTASTTVSLVDATNLAVEVRVGERSVSAHMRLLDESGNDFAALDTLDYSRYLTEGYSSTRRRFGPLPPGKYRIVAQSSEGSVEQELELEPGEERELVLQVR